NADLISNTSRSGPLRSDTIACSRIFQHLLNEAVKAEARLVTPQKHNLLTRDVSSRRLSSDIEEERHPGCTEVMLWLLIMRPGFV
ncbi:uncharacterized, partial [Tachysurus ichikawai]